MRLLVLALLSFAASASAEPYHLIPGAVPLELGPDGNTIVLDAPRGLIVFDSGRHPEHAQAILDYAKSRRRPIAAVVNSHWHLDHTTGNWDIRQAYPRVQIYATTRSKARSDLPQEQPRRHGQDACRPENPARRPRSARARDRGHRSSRAIRPNHIIAKSGRMTIAGRPLDVHLARFAATEGDVWLYDPKTRTAIVGDLVVGLVPFMDTACPDGWSKALGQSPPCRSGRSSPATAR